MTNLIGQQIDRYQVTEKMRGCCMTVYKARDTRLERDVVIKIARRGDFSNARLEKVLMHFDRDAMQLEALEHPSIVSVLDHGVYDGMPYLVMPHLPGGTLKERIGKPMPYMEAARLLLPVARALQFAHSQGIVHRNVKPSNILFNAAGETLLGDFGIARLLKGEAGATLTGEGIRLCSPEYMSPEQGLCQKSDERTDSYSLGIVFCELGTGRCPYKAKTFSALVSMHNTSPLPCLRELNPELPEKVEKIIHIALAKRRDERYPDMASFASVLNSLAHGVIPEIPTIKRSPLAAASPASLSTKKRVRLFPGIFKVLTRIKT